MKKGHFSRSGQHCALREKCLYSELFWSVFSSIWTEYGEIRSISPYSDQMLKNTDQNIPNADTFYAVVINPFQSNILFGSLKFSDILNGNKTGALT